MESPMSRTRGRFVSFACEIQTSHHSMASQAGGVIAFGSAAARLPANPEARERSISRLFIKNWVLRLGRILIGRRCVLYEFDGFIKRNARDDPGHPRVAQIS